MIDCHAESGHPPTADHENIMVELVLDDDCGHHDYGDPKTRDNDLHDANGFHDDKSNNIDLTNKDVDIDVIDRAVTVRTGEMIDEALCLPVLDRKEHLRHPHITANGLTQSDMADEERERTIGCRVGLHAIKVHAGL